MFKKVFLFITLTAFVGGLLATPFSVSAQTQCCVSPSSGALKACRVEKVSEPCKTALPRVVQAAEAIKKCKQPGFIDQFTLDYGQKWIDYNFCIQTLGKQLPPPEARGACISKGAKCIQALNLETECQIFDGDKAACVDSHSGRNCFFFGNRCYNRSDASICDRITEEQYCGTDKAGGRVKGSSVCQWLPPANGRAGRCTNQIEADLSARYGQGNTGFLTQCAAAGNCRSINDLVELLIRLAAGIFPWLGIMAFAFFIYGGITIILSFGSPEKVQHGKQILTAAIVGIVISFGAFLLIKFILSGLNVEGKYQSWLLNRNTPVYSLHQRTKV